MEFDYSKLNGRIVEKFDTQTKFASNITMATPTLTRKLHNESNFYQDEILEFCKLLEIEVTEIPEYFFTLKVR